MNMYIAAFLLLFTVSSTYFLQGSHPVPKTEKPATAKIVFKSTDGGQTWQDISQGLPENLERDHIQGNRFFANDKGLFLRFGDGLYSSTPNATSPFWTKAVFAFEQSSMAPGNSGKVYWGINLKKANGTSVWSPVFENLYEPRIRTAFETAGGAIFIGTDRGLFKTVNDGKTWKLVYAGGLVGHLAEADGVLLATSMRKIIRSTDGGENWIVVTGEDSLTFDVKPIQGGFAAITSSSETNSRRLKASYDGGKTWQPLDANLQNQVLIDSLWRSWNDRPRVQAFMTSIIQVGEAFFCTHPDGIFKSSDNGKTWKLLLPSVEGKGYNLFVSGNTIFAVRSNGGC